MKRYRGTLSIPPLTEVQRAKIKGSDANNNSKGAKKPGSTHTQHVVVDATAQYTVYARIKNGTLNVQNIRYHHILYAVEVYFLSRDGAGSLTTSFFMWTAVKGVIE